MIAMKIPITQTKSWQKLQQDLGETSFLEQGSGYHFLAILKDTPFGKYLYLPYGPIFEDKRGLENSLKSLKNLAIREQAFFTRVEPQSRDFVDHLPSSAKKSTDLNPAETWVLDLTGKDEDLKAKLPSRLLRYYKSASKKGITIETSHNPDDIHYLLGLQKSLAKKKGISTFSEEYFKTELKQPFATLYLVKQNQNVIAAGLVFDDKNTRYNLQGAQSDEGRRLHATGILTIQLILDAKAKNLKSFDFWGIAPEGAPENHPWAGFTAFKKTFAGKQVNYSGTYDLIYNSTKYHIYKVFRKLNRIIRRSR